MSENCKDKKILVMPAERIWLDNKLDQELYLKKWCNLLNNSNLVEFIEKNNINIYLYPNKQIQDSINKFKFDSKNISVIDDVKDLVKDSSLLVTDYSNIYMAFASMLKPVIYYQFDLNEYKKYNEKDPINLFGKLLKDEEDVVNRIIGYTNMNYRLENIYLKKINNYFGIEKL